MIMLDQLANGFINLEKVLDSPIIDVLAYSDYLAAKSFAEKAQYDYESQLRKNNKGR